MIRFEETTSCMRCGEELHIDLQQRGAPLCPRCVAEVYPVRASDETPEHRDRKLRLLTEIEWLRDYMDQIQTFAVPGRIVRSCAGVLDRMEKIINGEPVEER